MDIINAITAAAYKAGVASSLLLAICNHESNLKNVDVENDHGTPSIGVCQVKIGTSIQLGFRGTRKELAKPEVNAYYAGLYLKKQLDRYNNNFCMAVSAYNSGTYYENKKYPGKPRNIKYVNAIKNLITEENVAMLLECGLFESNMVKGY